MHARALFWLAMSVLVLTPLQTKAQFGIAPTDSLVEVFPTDSLTRIFQIDFPNQTEDSLGLSWRYVGGGWTDGWDVNLCDLGECYTGVPADAEMIPCAPDGAGYLKLLVNALGIEGECVLHFWVWPTGNQDALVNIYYDLRNGGVSHIHSAAKPPSLVAYPNPVRSGEEVRISGEPSLLEFPSSSMQRFGPLGSLHDCDVKATSTGWSISTQGWTSGMHLLRARESDGFIRLFVQ